MNIVLVGKGGLAREVETYFPMHMFRSIEVYPNDPNPFRGEPPQPGEYMYIAVGDPQLRMDIFNTFAKQAKNPRFGPPLIHEKAFIGPSCKLGAGTIVTPGVVVTTNVTIDDNVFLNLNCTVGHDAKIGPFTVINPGVNVSGNTTIGGRVLLGTNCCVLEKRTVFRDTIIGAGAVVSRDITEPGTYIGIPAKRKE